MNELTKSLQEKYELVCKGDGRFRIHTRAYGGIYVIWADSIGDPYRDRRGDEPLLVEYWKNGRWVNGPVCATPEEAMKVAEAMILLGEVDET